MPTHNETSELKPLGTKSYGSIGHLPGSRMGKSDRKCHEGQARIATLKARDRHDCIHVQEKLDGSNVGVARIDGVIFPLTRAGYLAEKSSYEQHWRFAQWGYTQQDRFLAVLKDGERLCGEWLLQAHGTRYNLQGEPFVVFDLMRGMHRATLSNLTERVRDYGFILPRLLSSGSPFTIKQAIDAIARSGHGAIDPVEGAVWRVERNELIDPYRGGERAWQVDFLVKYVRPDKVDGVFCLGSMEISNRCGMSIPCGFYRSRARKITLKVWKMNNFKSKLKEASNVFLSTRLSLLILTAQLLAELILVSELIGLLGGFIGSFPNFEFNEVRLLKLAQNAWILNLCYMLSLQMSYVFESTIPVIVSQRWLLTQDQLENWLERIPSLSLAKLSLQIGKVFLLTCLDLYIYFYSSDYKYLIKLTNTYSERRWAYFLAKDLFEYSFDERMEWLFLFNFFDQGKVIERIERRLKDEEIELFIKEQAIDYLNPLGIIHRANIVELSLEQEEEPEHFPEKIPRGCHGCKYLYGQSINGNLLVCAIHPYGSEDCPDLEVIPAIALTHQNCHLPNFYGVRTSMSLEELRLAIAYLQILRARLPSFETVEDSLYPDTVVELLGRLYECETIVSPNSFLIVETIDMSENWENYALSTNWEQINERVARIGAVKTILEIMYSQAYRKISNYSSPYYQDICFMLELISRGYYVPAQWELKTPNGEPYTGAISEGDLDDEPDWG